MEWTFPLQDFFFFWTVLQDIWVVLFDTNTAANSQGKWRQFGRDSDHGKTGHTQCKTISRRDAIYHHLWISVDHWGDFDRLFSISRENRIKLQGRRNSWGGYPWYKPSLKSQNAYISLSHLTTTMAYAVSLLLHLLPVALAIRGARILPTERHKRHTTQVTNNQTDKNFKFSDASCVCRKTRGKSSKSLWCIRRCVSVSVDVREVQELVEDSSRQLSSGRCILGDFVIVYASKVYTVRPWCYIAIVHMWLHCVYIYMVAFDRPSYIGWLCACMYIPAATSFDRSPCSDWIHQNGLPKESCPATVFNSK